MFFFWLNLAHNFLTIFFFNFISRYVKLRINFLHKSFNYSFKFWFLVRKSFLLIVKAIRWFSVCFCKAVFKTQGFFFHRFSKILYTLFCSPWKNCGYVIHNFWFIVVLVFTEFIKYQHNFSLSIFDFCGDKRELLVLITWSYFKC